MMDDTARAFLDGAVDSSTLPSTVIGRPPDYNAEIARKICDAICDGMAMREVAKLPNFPGKSTVFEWVGRYPEFRIAYAAAMEWRTEEDMDWLMDLATDASRDYKDEPTGDGATTIRVLDKTAIERSRLAVETLKWRIVRRQPGKYRDPDKPQTVIMPPAQQGLFQPGDDARLIGQGVPIEEDPQAESFRAWRKAAGK